MRKKELLSMPTLLATDSMMKRAEKDTPKTEKGYYSKRKVYKTPIYLRCAIEGYILKVAIFSADTMRLGGRQAMYEVYVNREKETFITFNRSLNKWSNAKLDMLSWPDYLYYSDSKWMSKKDNTMMMDFLGKKQGGYEGLLAYQYAIREKQLLLRHKKQTDPWDKDLLQVPKLPKDWERWVNKVGIQKNYIFYEYSPKGEKTGYCSYCERDVPIKNPRYNKEATCIRCRHEVTFKSVGKVGIIRTDEVPMYLIQRCKDGFVIREVLASRTYPRGNYKKPKVFHREIRCVIYDREGKADRAYYMGLYKQKSFRWIETGLCSPSWSYSHDGKIYGKTIPDLAKKELAQTGLPEAIRTFPIIDPEKYLAVLKEVPQLEQISKAGFPRLVKAILANYSLIKENKGSSLTELLGINKNQLKRLRRNDGDFDYLAWLQHESVCKQLISDDKIKWFCAEEIMPDDVSFISDHMRIIQIYNYLRRQMAKYKATGKEIIIKWSDYLSMAKRLKMDVSDEIIFRVNRLYLRHDELVEQCQEKEFALQAEEVLEVYPTVDTICQTLGEKYAYSGEDYAILPPSGIEDILQEGRTLSHCISDSDRYWDRIQRRESYILFLRKTDALEDPYYTLEVEPNGTVRQIRTFYDRQNPDIEQARAFLSDWQKYLAQYLTKGDLRLAEKSKKLRNLEFATLRDNRITIPTGALRGKLLIDVLQADLLESAA